MAKITYHHYGQVKNGTLIHYNFPLYSQTLSSLEGKEFDLIIKEKHKRVSLDTHGYYRAGIVKECMNYEMFGGWSEDDLHSFFADMFLKYTKMLIVNHDNGTTTQREITRIQSTSELNQKEMNEFIDKVVQWLAEHEIIIQSPESYYLGKYKTTEI